MCSSSTETLIVPSKLKEFYTKKTDGIGSISGNTARRKNRKAQ